VIRHKRRADPTKSLVKLISLAIAYLLVTLFVQFKPEVKFERITKVYDGDTVKITSGDKVRLIGIDTPEAYESDKLFRDAARTGQDVNRIKARGRLAAQFTKRIADGKPVRLEFDMERKDKYGRLLAYLFIPVCEWGKDEPPCQVEKNPDYEYQQLPGMNKDNGLYVFLNASIMKAGFAEPMNIRPNTHYADHFQQLYAEAQRTRRGLWGMK